MPISIDEATTIAREAGLGLPDAQALRVLADTPERARELAAKFAPDRREQEKAAADEVAARITRGDAR